MAQRYGSQDILRRFFEKWKSLQIVDKISKKNSFQHYRRQVKIDLGEQTFDDDKYQKKLQNSSNISYLEQRVHQKMTSFMTINRLLLNNYMNGTILQKNIDNLKHLALQQNALQRRMATHQINPRQDEHEQRIIENNVNKIMRGIFRIIFNKWVVYTHH